MDNFIITILITRVKEDTVWNGPTPDVMEYCNRQSLGDELSPYGSTDMDVIQR